MTTKAQEPKGVPKRNQNVKSEDEDVTQSSIKDSQLEHERKMIE